MTKRQINKRFRYVLSMEDINYILTIANIKTDIINGPYESHGPELKYNTYLEDNQRYIYITTKYVRDIENEDGSIEYKYDDKGKYACTWIFDKTGTESFHKHPSIISKLSRNVYKPENLVEQDFFYKNNNKTLNSAKPILGFNPKYDNTEHQVYCYDLNSAYAMVLRDKIIDTYSMKFDEVVGPNEVGFMMDNDLTMVGQGCYADVVFPLIDSPYRDYCDKWYKQKQDASAALKIEKAKEKPDKNEIKRLNKLKGEAKDVLVITVGLFQLNNPFLRAYVVNTCNNYIQSIINKYPDKICCWNTDAVYSTVPLDLPLGSEVGKFKLEYQGLFRQKGNNYQKVNDNETTYRGICKILFKKDWNILTDPLPENFLPFIYDKQKNIIRSDERYYGKTE